MRGILKFIHLFSLVVWFGGAIFLSVFVAEPMFRSFPIELAGDVMGVVFPSYFRMAYVAGFIALITLYFASKKKPWVRLVLIMAMLISTLYGGLIAGKKANDLRLSIKQEQNAGQKAALKENFHTQHRLSVISLSAVLILVPVVVMLTSRKLSDG
ncbi:MAG: DUF4149 domain-containing protein [Nitrospiria bacterium]